MDFWAFFEARLMPAPGWALASAGLQLALFPYMATQTFVDRPFPDLGVPDVLDTSSQSEIAGPLGVSRPSKETDSHERLSPARGVLVVLVLSAPFWVGVYWLFS
jgi:hypothetical protein